MLTTPILLRGILASMVFVAPVGFASTSTNVQQTSAAVSQKAMAVNTQRPAAERSPWLFVPLLSSSPKLDTAAGLMVGYLHQFDDKSRPSLFSVSAKYTTSESLIVSVFAKT